MELTERTSLTASGMMLWVNGINEAADNYSQVSDAHATGVIHDSDALFYGGRIGIKTNLN